MQLYIYMCGKRTEVQNITPKGLLIKQLQKQLQSAHVHTSIFGDCK